MNIVRKIMTNIINIDDCKKIISKYNKDTGNQFAVKSCEIVVATEAGGFFSEYYHLIIECFNHTPDLEQPGDVENDILWLRFFVKYLSPVDEDHENFRIFHKEVTLYNLLLPKLHDYSYTSWCPKMYLCDENLLVLEDLDTVGFCSLALRESLTENEIFPILNGLAVMHASSILYEFKAKDNIQSSYCDCLNEIKIHPDIPWFISGINALLEIAKRHSKYQTAKSQTFIRCQLPIYLNDVYLLVNPSLKYRNVLCHRDTWGANIFIDPHNPEKPAVFVDFQTCRYSPPAIDVIFTLFINLTKAERLKKQDEYLKYYYQQLIWYMSNHDTQETAMENLEFSEEEFLQSIEEFQLLGLVYRALAISIIKVPKEMVTDYYINKERSIELLGYMRRNEEFRVLMEESIEDIIEAVRGKNFYQN